MEGDNNNAKTEWILLPMPFVLCNNSLGLLLVIDTTLAPLAPNPRGTLLYILGNE